MNTVDPRHESAIDRTIREATERGAFDDLPGKGRPLPGAGRTGPVDENWWIRGYLEREGISGEAMLPPSIQLRKELDRIDDTVARLADERRVREHVEEVNGRVVDHMRHPMGPRVPIRRLDADEFVARWAERRAARRRTGPAAPAPAGAGDGAPARRGWWARLFGGT
ncbi:DUF1992 domain-containing protein [Pseudonocardia nematodicida]|uniref:DnaJ family domain-containing protein n=1 Tax=Pseudonocardia nematodicida TaxID=1206997 RepID=UPI003615D412